MSSQVLLKQVCQQVGISPHDVLVGAYIQENTSAALAFKIDGVSLKDRLQQELGISEIPPDAMSKTVIDFLKKTHPSAESIDVGASSRLQFLLAKDPNTVSETILQQWEGTDPKTSDKPKDVTQAMAARRADGIGLGSALAEGKLADFECPAGKLYDLVPEPRTTESILAAFSKPELRPYFTSLLTAAWASQPATDLEGLAMLAAPRAPWVRKRLAQSQDISVLKMAVLENYNASPEDVIQAVLRVNSTNKDPELASQLFQAALNRPDVSSFLRYQKDQAQLEPSGPAAQFMRELSYMKGLEAPAEVISNHLKQYDAKLAAAAERRKEQVALLKTLDDLLVAQRILFDEMYTEEGNKGRYALLAGPPQPIPPSPSCHVPTNPGFFAAVASACSSWWGAIKKINFGRSKSTPTPESIAGPKEDTVPFFKAKDEAIATVEQTLESENEVSEVLSL
jgi:hypothetical protein